MGYSPFLAASICAGVRRVRLGFSTLSALVQPNDMAFAILSGLSLVSIVEPDGLFQVIIIEPYGKTPPKRGLDWSLWVTEALTSEEWLEYAVSWKEVEAYNLLVLTDASTLRAANLQAISRLSQGVCAVELRNWY